MKPPMTHGGDPDAICPLGNMWLLGLILSARLKLETNPAEPNTLFWIGYSPVHSNYPAGLRVV